MHKVVIVDTPYIFGYIVDIFIITLMAHLMQQMHLIITKNWVCCRKSDVLEI